MKSIVVFACFLVVLTTTANGFRNGFAKGHTDKTLFKILRFIDHCSKKDDPKSCMKAGMENKCRKNGKFIQKHQMASAVCDCTSASADMEDCIKEKIATFCTKDENPTLFECEFFKKCKAKESSKAARMECLKDICGDGKNKEYHHTFQCRKIKAMNQIVHIQI